MLPNAGHIGRGGQALERWSLSVLLDLHYHGGAYLHRIISTFCRPAVSPLSSPPFPQLQWDGGVVLSQALTATDWLQRHWGGNNDRGLSGCSGDGSTWPSGSALLHCLELGAGTGAVGLSLAACHLAASVTITDIPDMLPHIELNVRRNAAAVQAGPAGARRGRQPPPGSRREVAASQLTAGVATVPGLIDTPATTPFSTGVPQLRASTESPTLLPPLPPQQQRHKPLVPGYPQPPPSVLVRPLRWGPPGEHISALFSERQRLEEAHAAGSAGRLLPGSGGGAIPRPIHQQQPDRDVTDDAMAFGLTVQQQQRRWRAPGPPYDVIVGSDLIYYTYSEETPHSKLLLWTLRRVAGPGSLVYLALSLHHNPEEVRGGGLPSVLRCFGVLRLIVPGASVLGGALVPGGLCTGGFRCLDV